MWPASRAHASAPKPQLLEGETVKAVRYHAYGDSDVLVYEDADRPVAGPGQVVVKMVGAAFNPADAGIRGGYLQQAFAVTFPHIPGYDMSGVIAEVGEGVSGWGAGDAVVAFLPIGVDGAVAGYAVQLATQAGATVTATGDPRSASRLHSYGADEVIDYTVTPLLQAVAGRRFDVVLNLVRTTPEETTQLTDLVTDGGTFLSTIPGPVTARDGVQTVQVFVRSDAAELAGLVARVDAGDLKIYVSQHRPLADLAAVHHEADAGRLAGKTILTP